LRHEQQGELYRIFVYDCPPYDGGLHLPVSRAWKNFKSTDLSVPPPSWHVAKGWTSCSTRCTRPSRTRSTNTSTAS
jgi:hypothetical protein